MASEPDASSNEAIPTHSAVDDNLVQSDGDDVVPDSDSFNVYSDDEQKPEPEDGTALDKATDADKADSGGSNVHDDIDVDNDDDYGSSLSSPPASSDEGVPETSPAQVEAQDPASGSIGPEIESSKILDSGSAIDTVLSVLSPSSEKGPAAGLASPKPSSAQSEAASHLAVPAASVDAMSTSAAGAGSHIPTPDATAGNAVTHDTNKLNVATADAAPLSTFQSMQVQDQNRIQPHHTGLVGELSDLEVPQASAGLEVQTQPENSEPGIDIDKMLDAISAEAADPPPAPSLPSTAAAAATPAHPLPKPPTGPSRMAGRNAANRPGGTLPAEKPANFSYVAAGAPGTVGGVTVLGSPPSSSVAAFGGKGQATRAPQGPASRQANNREKGAVEKAYQAFLAEEKSYMSDANWDKFPEGSRMFIGNLSQERVSKRDVFEKFYKFGRLAQVSIKSAYGFVQYHTAAEAQEAMKHLQGIEIRGRKINLEISKTQRKDGGRDRDRDRERSPDRGKSRGNRGADRYDGREGSGRRSRDDYRPEGRDRRDASPGRDRIGNDHYAGDRRNRRRSRDRSQSPGRHGNGGSKSYRSRRSPSPYGRNRNDSSSGFDGLRSRHGSDVPDVQFLVTQGLERDYIKWVQNAFTERGLKTDIMLLTPHSPSRDTVIQTHVLEGVIAVVDLNINTQKSGKIPLQVFDRSAGASSVRFDGYQDLSPQIAADVVVRAKSTAVAQPQQHLGYQAAPAAGYGQQFASAVPGYQGSAAASQAPAPAAPALGYDLAALAGQLDSTTLAQLLGALQGAQPAAAAPATAAYPQSAPYAANAAQQVNLAALLGNLGAPQAAAGMAGVPAYGSAAVPYTAGAPATTSASYPSVPQGANDQNIQAIMAQLAKFRQ